MEGKSLDDIINEALAKFVTPLDQELSERFQVVIPEQDPKANKKKNKRIQIEDNDSNEKALQKFTKQLDELVKNFQQTGKQLFKTKQGLTSIRSGEAQKQKTAKQRDMFQNLYNNFKKKYDDEIKNANQVEKEEEQKRKQKIEELQERIKTIQDQYEVAGKIKVEKYKENEMLKHELSKYQPHLIASQSLAEAQLKKKSIEIEIQMTTLKQKIEMMNSFRSMREETQNKMKSGQELEQKLDRRLGKLNEKEEEHKLCLAKAHLIFEDYKKAFNVLKVQLPQLQKDAFLAKQKVKKALKSLEEIKSKNEGLDKQTQTNLQQLQTLRKLQSQIQKQLQE